MIKMLYNRCTGIYKFGNNTYPRSIRRRSNLGHFFGKSASYGPGKTVYSNSNYSPIPQSNVEQAVPLDMFIISYSTEGFDRS